ncbi:RNA 2',3'-cyclic phosphodiesterase [Streptomyces sp. bgisy100]|uniref:RNA 2',3'-cyclic phosphodiesterase n=1 Tax=Streptomyces sp. bgisy100 TaxID=3413783 RepID=UPI003D734ADC
MRLFAAVLPPQEAVAELADEIRTLHALPTAGELRWTGHESWHFTLAFYGEVPEDVVPELRERLARAAHRHGPYELRLAGGGRFGARALWAGADGDREAMRHLADTVSAAGRRAGVRFDDHRHFTPHLTIARNRRDADLRPYVEELAEFVGSPWTVRELCLVRSHPPVAGVAGQQPRYETVGAWPLGE